MFGKEHLDLYTRLLEIPNRAIVGRDNEIETILASLYRPELCNVIMLGEAGVGKTAIVQGIAKMDKSTIYVELLLSKLISDVGKDTISGHLDALFNEVTEYVKDMHKPVVLFIDEFHRLVQESEACVEALKPLLADSGTRNVRIIAATTYIEFQKWIAHNQPLVQRFHRININAPDKNVVLDILKDRAKRNNVSDIIADNIYEAIYDYTNKYIPANSQPRKSILMLDAMIGWYRFKKCDINMKLLADVIYSQEGINVAFNVDASNIKKELDKHVLSQKYATSMVEYQLHMCVAGLNDTTKPMSSFLFTGSTGVGKTELAKQLARILFNDERRLVRFDMTDFSTASTLDMFKQELTSRVWQQPFSILLLDEIEKACPEVIKTLLPVLDDGRLLDANNREVVFNNCYIILTTNAGAEIYKQLAQYNVDDEGSGNTVKQYMRLIRRSLQSTIGDNKFPPELLGRIDCIVPFQPLSNATMRDIILKRLILLAKQVYDKHGVTLVFNKDKATNEVAKDIRDYIVNDKLTTDSDSGGARSVIKTLESEVTMAVARYINMHPHDKRLYVNVVGDTAYDNKQQLISKAYINISNGIRKDK